MSSLQVLIHLAGIVNFAYGIYFQLYLDIPSSVSKTRNLYGGPWKFLTVMPFTVAIGASSLIAQSFSLSTCGCS
jgi:hypothetical protein